MKLTQKYIKLKNGTISYLEGGNKNSSNPTIFIHGFLTSSKAYRPSLELLANKHWVIAPDLPGFGNTIFKTKHIKEYGDFSAVLEKFLDKIEIQSTPRGQSDLKVQNTKNTTPPQINLIGHSMGGGISIYFAATHPDRVNNLILVDSAGLPLDLSVKLLMKKSWETLVIQSINSGASPEFINFKKKVALNIAKKWIHAQRIINIPMKEDLSDYMKKINTPTLILWGDKDQITPLSNGLKMAEMIGGSKMHVLDNRHHNWCALYPEEFVRAVELGIKLRITSPQ